MRFWHMVTSVLLILAAGLGLAVMAGQARGLLAPGLQANLVVQAFPVPQNLGIDPAKVAGFMAAQLQDRIESDVAMRLTLKPEVLTKVKTIVLPRLMNVVVVQAMMHDIPELSAVLDLAAFRQSVSGTVLSTGAARDVALTVPGLLLAQVDGQGAKITTTSTGLTALSLGDFAPGQSHQVTLWLGEGATGADLGARIRLGAGGTEQRGRVLLWGAQGWFGADIEALRWARWLVGGILGGALLFGLASLVLPLITARQTRTRASR